MKKGILRTLGVFVSLALMLAAFPASVAMAAATVSNLVIQNIETGSTYNGDAEGLKNDKIALTLTGITDTYYSLYFSSQQASKGDDIDDEVTTYKEWESIFYTTPGSNSYVSPLNLPSNLLDGAVDESSIHGGVYYFYVTEYHPTTGTVNAYSDTDILFVAEYYIHGIADVAVDETQGVVGDQVQVEGSGFAPDEYIILKYDNVEINDYIVSGDEQVDTDGTFSFIFTVPPSVKGSHTIKVTGENSRVEEEFTFTVSPSITISATSGAAGTIITVYGEGFSRSKYVDVYFGSTKVDDNNASVRTDRTNSAGSITYVMTVPASAPSGTYAISIEDENNANISASINFTVTLNSILTLSVNTGNVGDAVTVTGTNFSPSTTLTILFDNITVGTVTTDAGGNFTSQVSIPAAVCGAHTIKIGSFGQTYTITPKITLDKTQGIAGTTVTITGTGFAASTAITATFNNSAVALSSSITNTTGGFVVTFTVPTAATGSYNVQVTAGSLASAGFSIVDASLSLGASSGHVGDAVTVTGTNFAAGSSVSITFDGTVVATPTADASGGFTATFNVPTAAGGTHTVVASSGAISKSTTFTVTANVSVTPATGNVGTQVTLSGTGFNANANVTITYNGSALQSGTAMTTNAAGALTVSFQVPASPSGARTVAVSDGVNSASATFVMEATAPAAPTLTSPVYASQEKGIVTFDWSDVTDVSSPVTYRLQVASDSGFSTVVVNVAGLTESTYTLTDAEKLVKLADGGSYYWRVIASDAASNTSASSVNTFTVGGSMPSWLMWVWIGIGIVVVFIFAIWLGRRLAYSSY